MKRKPIIIPEVNNIKCEPYYGYIYLTFDSKYYKFYVGKKETMNFDSSYFGSGTLLLKARSNHPNEFTCKPIDWAYTKDELNLKEKWWIEYLEALSDINKPLELRDFYNLLPGGDGGKLSGDSLERMKKSRKGKCIGENNPNYTGRAFTDKSKEKLRQHMLGKNLSQETKEKISKSNTGKKMSEESKIKNRIAHTGMKATKETREKISKNRTGIMTGKDHPLSRAVVRLTMNGEFVEEYDSVIGVKKSSNIFISEEDVRKCCKGKQKQYKGYKWMYKEDYDKMVKNPSKGEEVTQSYG